jgi:hypothetical protein
MATARARAKAALAALRDEADDYEAQVFSTLGACASDGRGIGLQGMPRSVFVVARAVAGDTPTTRPSLDPARLERLADALREAGDDARAARLDRLQAAVADELAVLETATTTAAMPAVPYDETPFFRYAVAPVPATPKGRQ